MTTMNEANRDKKGTGLIFFVMSRLSVLLNSMSKLIHNRYTCKLVIKTLRLQTCLQKPKRTIASLFLCFNPLFSVVQL